MWCPLSVPWSLSAGTLSSGLCWGPCQSKCFQRGVLWGVCLEEPVGLYTGALDQWQGVCPGCGRVVGSCAKGLMFQEELLVLQKGVPKTEVVLPPLLKEQKERSPQSHTCGLTHGLDSAVCSEGGTSVCA